MAKEFHFGVDNPSDPGMTEDEHVVWQSAVLNFSPYDCIVGYKVNTKDGDSVKWFLNTDYDKALDLALSIEGATVEQVNKSDILD